MERGQERKERGKKRKNISRWVSSKKESNANAVRREKQAKCQSSGYSSLRLLTNLWVSGSHRLKWRPANLSMAGEGGVLEETGDMFSEAT
jgi:hypothetical protein